MSSRLKIPSLLLATGLLSACADRFASSRYIQAPRASSSPNATQETATLPRAQVPKASLPPVRTAASPTVKSAPAVESSPAPLKLLPLPKKFEFKPETKSDSIVFKQNQPSAGHQPLLWEKGKAETVMWSTYAMQLIGDEAAGSLLPGAKDVEEFCPRYSELERAQKINFWAYLVSAVAKYESGFDPTDRMTEKGLGTDYITGKQVVSEGLLQLSYQDIRGRSSVCDFDWDLDRSMAAKDPRKSILDPYKNLKCGISILAKQIKSRQMISIYEGGYWSVLRPEGYPYSEVRNIKKLTHQLTFCTAR